MDNCSKPKRESYVVTVPGIARIKINKKGDSWEISEWFTTPSMQNKGIGSKVFKQGINHVLCCTLEIPSKITYVWNGENEYVGKWLSKFDAKCTCPAAVLKNLDADTWDAHVYELNTRKVLDFAKDELFSTKIEPLEEKER